MNTMMLKIAETNSGWSYYSGFISVQSRVLSVSRQQLRSEFAQHDTCVFILTDPEPESAVLKICTRKQGEEEPTVFFVNTRVYLLNEQGQTIERLW